MQKAQIVEDSFNARDSVCAVARSRGLSSKQLFAWRKAAREQAMTTFVPVLVEPAITPVPAVPSKPLKARRSRSAQAQIELKDCRPARAGEPRSRGEDGRGGDQCSEGQTVIAPVGMRVLVATKAVDFRTGAGGLAALV